MGLRPETLTLLYDDQKASERETEGVIDEVIYFGDMTYYDVYLGGTDVEVRLSMRNVPGRPVLDVGTRKSASPGAPRRWFSSARPGADFFEDIGPEPSRAPCRSSRKLRLLRRRLKLLPLP